MRHPSKIGNQTTRGRERYALLIEAIPGNPDPLLSLKALVKAALRSYRFRVVRCESRPARTLVDPERVPGLRNVETKAEIVSEASKGFDMASKGELDKTRAGSGD